MMRLASKQASTASSLATRTLCVLLGAAALAWVLSTQLPNMRADTGSTTLTGRTFALQHVRVTEVEPALKRLLSQQAPDARIAVDVRSNRLFVQGPETVLDQVADLIARSDTSAKSPALESAQPPGAPPVALPGSVARGGADAGLHAVPLKHLTARQLEAIIGDFLPGVVDSQQAPFGQMEGQPDSPTSRITIPLEQGQVLQLDMDRQSNGVAMRGPAHAVRLWSRILAGLDQPRRSRYHTARIVSHDGAAQEPVTRMLQWIQDPTSTATVVDPRSLAATRARAAIGGTSTNHAFVATTNETDNTPPQAAPAHDPQAPAKPEDKGDAGLLGPVQIEHVEGSDVIIIKGHERDVQRVRDMIDEIKRLSQETEPEIQLLPLQHVDSPSLAQLLQQLYQDVYSPRQGKVTITPLAKPNALLLIGRPEAVKVVLRLVQLLDQPVPPESQLHLFPLRHMGAAAAERLIRNFFEEADAAAAPAAAGSPATGGGAPSNPGGGRGSLATKVRIISDARSNSLIVQASPRNLADVSRMLLMLDVETSHVVDRVQIFPLRNARAEDVAPVLESALRGQAARTQPAGPLPGQIGSVDPVPAASSPSAGDSARGTTLTFRTIGPEGEVLLKSGIMSDVRIAANPSTNSLIVTGPEQAMGLIAALIDRLDQLPSSEVQIKVFTLHNGDATGLRDLLEELFQQRSDARRQRTTPVLPQLESGLTTPLRFSVDQRTNSLIVSGPSEDLNVVHALIMNLDGVDIRQRKNLVYRLRYTRAREVAEAIQSFLRAEQQRTQQQLAQFTQSPQSSLSPFEQIEREVVVVSERLSNTLIISATPRFYDQIVQIISDIDAIPPMVMVQVLIAEVAFANEKELGVELGLQDALLFDRGSILGGTINQASVTAGDLAGQGLTGLGLGRTNSRLGFGGMVLSAGSESVNILIRALEQRGKVQVLSRPQIMTHDNKQAIVQVGSNVLLPAGTNTTINGLVNITTAPVSVGLILQVLPNISPDDTVTLTVEAERSRLGPEDEGTAIAIDSSGTVVRSPKIELARAETVISVPSGQTAVFSGLLTKEKRELSRRVPMLSDIPALGGLFRYDSSTEINSELLIIMTPHVIHSPGDLARISEMESARMHWCMADVVSMHGDSSVLGGGNGGWSAEDIPTIFPDNPPAQGIPYEGMTAPGLEPIPLPPGAAPGNAASETTPPTLNLPNQVGKLP